VLVSPLSGWQCGTIAQNGTAGAAKAGLRRALSIPASAKDAPLNAATLALNDALRAQTGAQINVANALWIDRKFQFVPAFSQTCNTYFGAKASTLDFQSPSAVQGVNDWVSKETRGKITDLLQPGDLKATSFA
jgi:serpin B